MTRETIILLLPTTFFHVLVTCSDKQLGKPTIRVARLSPGHGLVLEPRMLGRQCLDQMRQDIQLQVLFEGVTWLTAFGWPPP